MTVKLSSPSLLYSLFDGEEKEGGAISLPRLGVDSLSLEKKKKKKNR